MLPSGARTVIFLQFHAATISGGTALKFPIAAVQQGI